MVDFTPEGGDFNPSSRTRASAMLAVHVKSDLCAVPRTRLYIRHFTPPLDYEQYSTYGKVKS